MIAVVLTLVALATIGACVLVVFGVKAFNELQDLP